MINADDRDIVEALSIAYARGISMPESLVREIALRSPTGVWIEIQRRRAEATSIADDPSKPKIAGGQVLPGREAFVIVDMRGDLWRIDPRPGTYRKCVAQEPALE